MLSTYAQNEHILQENRIDLKHLDINKLHSRLSELSLKKSSILEQFASTTNEIKELELIHQNLKKYLDVDSSEPNKMHLSNHPSL